eukprot:TRINITY_DN28979_c0_g1_i1.p1 TRINITY_DN28979_c0_g1~~TRINITY_DN28979_c0_g1_i1.p1  ORF type:complete len:494 (+),score=93.72 TRINITY_DN28979_c0_g1_i1:237-1718(+)
MQTTLTHLLSFACAAMAYRPPAGHAMYTYSLEPFSQFEHWNSLPGNGTVSIANVYGGWAVRTLTHAAINCTSKPVVPNQQIVLQVINTAPEPVTLLGCAEDSCHGTAYTRCPTSIPAGANATLALDPGLHFLVMVYNSSLEQECWPKQYGSFPASLTLPMKDPVAECAAAARPPGPAPPLPPSTYTLDLEPVASTGAPQADFKAWSAVAGIDWLVANLDGRMNMCELYQQYNMSGSDCSSAPDVQNMTGADFERFGNQVVDTFCTYDKVAGVQLDLEPFRAPYARGIVQLMRLLAEKLRTGACVSSTHPEGRFLGLFAFPDGLADSGLLEAISPNGFITISGYDLAPDSADSKFNTVDEYKAKLQSEIGRTVSVMTATNTSWTLGIPATASNHEYKAYLPSTEHCGPACTQYNNTATMVEYVKAALQVARGLTVNAESLFRGFTLWKWVAPGTPPTDYPQRSGNRFYPEEMASDTLAYLKQSLPAITATVQMA